MSETDFFDVGLPVVTDFDIATDGMIKLAAVAEELQKRFLEKDSAWVYSCCGQAECQGCAVTSHLVKRSNIEGESGIATVTKTDNEGGLETEDEEEGKEIGMPLTGA